MIDVGWWEKVVYPVKCTGKTKNLEWNEISIWLMSGKNFLFCISQSVSTVLDKLFENLLKMMSLKYYKFDL